MPSCSTDSCGSTERNKSTSQTIINDHNTNAGHEEFNSDDEDRRPSMSYEGHSSASVRKMTLHQLLKNNDTNINNKQTVDMENDNNNNTSGFILMHTEILQSLISDFLCPECHSKGVFPSVNGTKGYATKILLKCPNCLYVNNFWSSPKLTEKSQLTIKMRLLLIIKLFSVVKILELAVLR
ncbi:hypothetical protein SNE40_005947 [Patella caerulea]|uniref:Uncharacterized protein n=1 Tax=Patella caerulea TaxID=87958 RepID=A0AAN8JZD3_PATCE